MSLKPLCINKAFAAPLRIKSTSHRQRRRAPTGHQLNTLPHPPLKSAPAPAQRAGMKSLLMMDDVTKLLSGVMSRLALQGDGPLREPSPRQGRYFMCCCQPLNRNPKGAPTIQQLTIPPSVPKQQLIFSFLCLL